MTIANLGSIIKEIRTQKLKISQGKFAEEVGGKQAMISRLELGKGCTLELFFKICIFLKMRKINLYHIFAAPVFSIEHIDMLLEEIEQDKDNPKVTSEQRKEQIQELINEIETSHNEELNRVRQLVSSI